MQSDETIGKESYRTRGPYYELVFFINRDRKPKAQALANI